MKEIAATITQRGRVMVPAEVRQLLGVEPGDFDDLTGLAGLGPGSRALEIGCGTGQATLPLAERGCEIVAVELGPRLAAVARRKLARGGHPAQ